ncbi:MAG: hypothetical protein E7H48_15125 [Acinetobacter baumannii]|nr:hypothetical protein [Acinetobacter baumannii]
MKIHEVSMASAALNDKHSYPRVIKYGGVSKSMLKQSRLNFDKIEKCE